MTYDYLSKRCRRPSEVESGHPVGVVCTSLFKQTEHRARVLVANGFRHCRRDGIGRQQPNEPHAHEKNAQEPHPQARWVAGRATRGKPDGRLHSRHWKAVQRPAPGQEAAVPYTILPKAASSDAIVASLDGTVRKGRRAALHMARVREATSAPSRLNASDERHPLPPRP